MSSEDPAERTGIGEESSVQQEVESDTKRRKVYEEASDNKTTAESVTHDATEGSSQFINDKWIFRYKTGQFTEFDDKKNEWKPIGEDEVEFYEQLWFQTEEDNKKTASTGGDKSVVDDEFLAQYHANYGIEYDYEAMGIKVEKPPEEKKEEDEKGKKTEPRPPGWVDMDEKVNAVYVSNLPSQITIEEFVSTMAKAGIIQDDARSNKPKAKLYKDEEGNNKGDGRCCYVKKESVELALTLLDGMMIHGKPMKVEKAHFELKGEYDPKKRKRKLTAAQKKRFIEKQNQRFDWRPDKPRNYRPISDCTVIIKNLFTFEQLNENAGILFDIKEELNLACAKYGTVKKVVVFENNPEGVAGVTFDSTVGSDEAVKMLNGRMVRGKMLEAHLWDGKTKYNVEETEEERKARLEKWNKYIEGEAAKEEEEGDAEKTEKVDHTEEGIGSSSV